MTRKRTNRLARERAKPPSTIHLEPESAPEVPRVDQLVVNWRVSSRGEVPDSVLERTAQSLQMRRAQEFVAIHGAEPPLQLIGFSPIQKVVLLELVLHAMAVARMQALEVVKSARNAHLQDTLATPHSYLVDAVEHWCGPLAWDGFDPKQINLLQIGAEFMNVSDNEGGSTKVWRRRA